MWESWFSKTRETHSLSLTPSTPYSPPHPSPMHAPSSCLLPHPGPAQPRVPPSSCQDEPSCLLRSVPLPPHTPCPLQAHFPHALPAGPGMWGDKTAHPSWHFPAGSETPCENTGCFNLLQNGTPQAKVFSSPAKWDTDNNHLVVVM